jgi:hypothetical protein
LLLLSGGIFNCFLFGSDGVEGCFDFSLKGGFGANIGEKCLPFFVCFEGLLLSRFFEDCVVASLGGGGSGSHCIED